MMAQFTEADLERARTRWDVIAADVPMKRQGRELAGCCPFHTEKTPSFYINPDKGFFHCFGCGAHGTAIDYLMRARGLEFVAAVRHLLNLPEQRAKQAAPVPKRTDSPPDEDRVEEIYAILAGCQPITPRTAAQLYLWSRGCTHADRYGLLAHEALYCHEVRKPLPAIVAPINSSTGEITAIQRIWLSSTWIPDQAPDSRAPLKIRKKTLGHMGDGACRLRSADHRLGLAEGVETGIAACELFRWPVWAVCGVGRLGMPGHWRQLHTAPGEPPVLWFPPERPPADLDTRWMPARPPAVWVPPEIERLVIYGDNGRIGRAVANYAASYWHESGVDAVAEFPAAGFDDFNDQLLGVAA